MSLCACAAGGEPATIKTAMTDPTTITIDRAGRVVIPKEIRDEAGIEPGMALEIRCREGRIEIEPRRRPVRIVKKGRLQVAESVETGETLTRATVRKTAARD
jgi:AbrB family looped-hinge helix DNA binding protein